ncbi:tRNA-specific 2-thiouridylase MnmA [Candidatus Purcelliella pentastirinorum]|uniref:tRNA-specific 2-thiouridylase MnmA n=1 Tax=Candidatus Purcelliella pentastirinorum TaxID=472834 RepID=A0A346DZQ9_9ENTR|nr:tRNA 2-thiouridine(34) synthase MnmA [Candidatus Purcelliella pentastirinorum]AXN02214.1 tRNA-specific 2-thiouridylase MnmA [Candidatus Purcelliella pentastirinorum]
MKKVIIAMSGGVDSSVSAWILKNKGYHVEGLFMKNWEEDDNKNYCNSKKDLQDTETICEQLKIKLHKMNFSIEYWNNVFKNCISEYKLGKTPNPDIICNKEIKFKLFLKFALNKMNADYIATGHYARTKIINKKYSLLKGIDKKKDQSYFLYTIKNYQIKKILFPIGHLKKIEVRKIANKLNFINANKKDSTGICFIGKRKFINFIEKYIPNKIGKIIDINNNTIGKHKNAMYYTLGQRKWLGIGGIKNKKNSPWYVIDKDIKKNTLIVDQNRYTPYLQSKSLILNKIHWINKEKINLNLEYEIKVRYNQKSTKCKIKKKKNKEIKVKFKNPIIAVTPGQSIVFYFNDICLGGGIIKKNIPIKKYNIKINNYSKNIK